MISSVPAPSLFTESVPSRDEVLGQAINFDPERWKRLLPDPTYWPPDLDECPRGKKWPYVDRQLVMRIGEQAQGPLGAARIYVASAVWGSGTKAQSVARRIAAFDPAHPAELGNRVAAGLAVLRAEGPVAAYARLNSGDGHVRGLGPAFFTKVLSFAGWDSAAGDLRPLILDQFVAIALNHYAGCNWKTTGWSSEQYEQYLVLADCWVDQAPAGTTSDAVEYWLFNEGKRLAS